MGWVGHRWWTGWVLVALVSLPGWAGPRKVPMVFLVQTPEDLPVRVEARPERADVEVGRRFRVEYTFHNPSERTLRFMAGHFVAPPDYFAYVEMIECFCITGPDKVSRAITLKAGQTLRAAAVFRVDPSVPPVRRLTISYMLVPVSGE